MPSSTTPGSSTSISSRQQCRHRPSPKEQRLGTPKVPAIRFPRGEISRLNSSHICYGLPVCSAPCTDLTGLPANGAFYIQAFNGSVTLPVAGYDYNIDWTPMLVGLAPTRMAASLAAPELRKHSDVGLAPVRNVAAGRRTGSPLSLVNQSLFDCSYKLRP